MADDASAYRPDSVLVRFKADAAGSQRRSAHMARGARVVRDFARVDGLVRVALPAGSSVDAAVAAYRDDPTVLYAEPDYRVRISLTPNDSQYGAQWSLHNAGQSGGTADADIDAPEAWNLTTGSASVVVAILDSGIDTAHPDLVDNLFRNEVECIANGLDDDFNGYADDCHGIDLVNGDSDPSDDNGHGTHVAGIVGATGNNGAGIAGIAWDVSLLACKFLDADGNGFSSDAVACLDYVDDMKARGADIVATNNSWGGGASSQALIDAIDAQRASDTLFIASAGNNASDNDIAGMLPASYFLPNIISVAASDHDDAMAGFSNIGDHTVSIAAPGVDVLSTFPLWGDNAYEAFDGTSMAAPQVSGVAALLKAQDPSRDWRGIRNRILLGGDVMAGPRTTISQRRLNAYGALTCSAPPLKSWLRPRASAVTFPVGTEIAFAVLHISCDGPAGALSVDIDPGAISLPLLDDGLGHDLVAGDGIYSAAWTPPGEALYTASFPGGETLTINTDDPSMIDPEPQDLGFFGQEVTRVGSHIVIGRPGGGEFVSGAAYVYDAVSGELVRRLENPEPIGGDRFGIHLAALGDTRVAVSATYHRVDGVDHGIVYVFDVTTGMLLHTLRSPAPRPNGLFGWAVTEVGSDILVTEPKGAAPFFFGAAHLFDGETGALRHTIYNPGSTAGMYGGDAVATARRLFVAENGIPASVYVYDVEAGSPTFGSLLHTLRAPPPYDINGNFGRRLTIALDQLFVGNPSTSLDLPRVGAVHVYDVATGNLIRTIENPAEPHYDPVLGLFKDDEFGKSLATVGPTVLVGAPQWVGPIENGVVYRFDASTGALLDATPFPSPFEQAWNYGHAIAGYGDDLFVGDPNRAKLGGPGFIVAAGAAYHVRPGPLPDAGKCYTARSNGTPPPRRDVALRDRFSVRNATVIRPRQMCMAAAVSDASVLHPDEGRTCYRSRSTRGASPFTRQTIQLRNRHAIYDLVVSKPGPLCFPADDGNGATSVGDAYACYRARTVDRLSQLGVELTDRFATGEALLGPVTSVCAPVGIDGAAVKRPDRFLVCHKLRPVDGQPRFDRRDVPNRDAMMDGALRLTKPDELCLPAREGDI